MSETEKRIWNLGPETLHRGEVNIDDMENVELMKNHFGNLLRRRLLPSLARTLTNGNINTLALIRKHFMYQLAVLGLLQQDENPAERKIGINEIAQLAASKDADTLSTCEKIFSQAVFDGHCSESVRAQITQKALHELGLSKDQCKEVQTLHADLANGDPPKNERLEKLFSSLGLSKKEKMAIICSWELNHAGYRARNSGNTDKTSEELAHQKVARAYMRNLVRMFLIEKFQRGGIKTLQERCSLFSPIKFPLPLIFDQIDPTRQDTPFFGFAASGQADDFTFCDDQDWLIDIRKSGGRLAIAECSSFLRLQHLIERVDNIAFGHIHAHANDWLLVFGHGGPLARLYEHQLYSFFKPLKKRFLAGASLFFQGCRIGKGKMPQKISRALDHVSVVAPYEKVYGLEAVACSDGRYRIRLNDDGSQKIVHYYSGKKA